MREKMITIWDELVQMNKVRPYVFKTRLQRAILRTKKYGMEQDDTSLQQLCENWNISLLLFQIRVIRHRMENLEVILF